jgi:hypothetical protein
MRQQKSGQQRLNRLQLIARVQLAYEQLREALPGARRGSRRARLAATEARQRLDLLNRALAMLALESAAAPVAVIG